MKLWRWLICVCTTRISHARKKILFNAEIFNTTWWLTLEIILFLEAENIITTWYWIYKVIIDFVNPFPARGVKFMEKKPKKTNHICYSQIFTIPCKYNIIWKLYWKASIVEKRWSYWSYGYFVFGIWTYDLAYWAFTFVKGRDIVHTCNYWKHIHNVGICYCLCMPLVVMEESLFVLVIFTEEPFE